MIGYATPAEVALLTGRTFTSEELERIDALIPLVSDALRMEARKVNKDLDEMAEDESFASVLKMVTVDVVLRAMRQPSDGEPISQESQSGLGYTWSGTYAVPGGGISGCIMNNDLKRLGLRRQRYGGLDMLGGNGGGCCG